MKKIRRPRAPPAPGTPIRYTAVGASDVWGDGSSAPCLVLFADCPRARGMCCRGRPPQVRRLHRHPDQSRHSDRDDQPGFSAARSAVRAAHLREHAGRRAPVRAARLDRRHDLRRRERRERDHGRPRRRRGRGRIKRPSSISRSRISLPITRPLVDGIRDRIGASGRIIALNLIFPTALRRHRPARAAAGRSRRRGRDHDDGNQPDGGTRREGNRLDVSRGALFAGVAVPRTASTRTMPDTR